MRKNRPLCAWCKHLDPIGDETRTCRAFPYGIPDEIWADESFKSVKFDHRESHVDDHGIQFEKEETEVLWKTISFQRYSNPNFVDRELAELLATYDERRLEGRMQPPLVKE